MDFIAFDTEDNSPELIRSKLPANAKRITQICARNSWNKDVYYSGGSKGGNVLELLRYFLSCSDSRPGQVFVYAHNLKYDLGNLFGKSLDAFDTTLIGGRMINARWGGLIFRDSFNLWLAPLAVVGQSLGFPKLPTDIHSRAYVMRDVDIVYKSIQLALRIAKRYGIDELSATIGGLGVKCWRALGGENWHCSDPEIREAYYGGRVELFRKSIIGTISYTDIDSLYPWALSQGFPTDYRDANGNLSWHGLASCTIEVPRGPYPCLPVRRKDGSVYYPWGRLTGLWTTAEIRNAQSTGARVVRVNWVKGSPDLAFYYRDYVKEFHRLKFAAKTPAEREFFKRLLTNFYGQLGTTGIVTRSYPYPRDAHRGGVIFGGKILADCQTPIPEHANFLHAAWVTALGRIRLHEFMRQVDPENLLYCDTDSLIFAGQAPFPIRAALGEMKLEDFSKNGCAAAYVPKAYHWLGKFKAKGVPRRLAKEFVTKGEVNYEQPFNYREAVAWFDRGNKKQLSVWREVTKRFSGVYDRKHFIRGLYVPKKHIDL